MNAETARSQRLHKLVALWSERETLLLDIEARFREFDNQPCGEVARAMRREIVRCREELRGEMYPIHSDTYGEAQGAQASTD